MKLTIQLALFLTTIFSCNTEKTLQDSRVVKDWVGSTIDLPEGMEWELQGNVIDANPVNHDYKIITLVDSTGCVPCRLKFKDWNDVMDELNINSSKDVECFVIIGMNDRRRITYLSKRDAYRHPIAFNTELLHEIMKELPNKIEYHTFLLDEYNRIQAIGNPVINPKVKELYKKIIMQNADYGFECENVMSKSVGLLQNKGTANFLFMLNYGASSVLSIQKIIPSCECVKTSVSDTKFGSPHNINISLIGDSTTGYFQKYVDVFYNERDKPDRLTIRGYCK